MAASSISPEAPATFGRLSPTQHLSSRKASGASTQTSVAGSLHQSGLGTASGDGAGGAASKQNFKRLPHHHSNHVSDFNMEKTKFRVLKAIEDKAAPPKFRSFFKSALMDRFLQATLLYFISRFQHQMVSRRQEIYGNAKDGTTFAINGRSLDQLKKETERHMEDLAAAYAQIILTQSDYRHTQHDKFFFEALYESTHQVLIDAFAGHRRGNELEIELGRIFRSDTFNLSKRRHTTRYTTENLSVRDIYKLKHEGNYALNYKLLRNLFQRKDQSGASQLGVDQCSPVINLLFSKRGGEPQHRRGAASDHNASPVASGATKMDDSSGAAGSGGVGAGAGGGSAGAEAKDGGAEAKDQQSQQQNKANPQDIEAFPVASSIEYLENVKLSLLSRGSDGSGNQTSSGRERGDSMLSQ